MMTENVFHPGSLQLSMSFWNDLDYSDSEKEKQGGQTSLCGLTCLRNVLFFIFTHTMCEKIS